MRYEREQPMNERQARQEGFSYTYGGRTHEEIKETAAKLRREGNRAIMVWVPPNPLSRGYDCGHYSVYWIESDSNRAKRIHGENLRKLESLKQKYKELTDELVAMYSEIKAMEKELSND
jgi:hypothetical protein